MIVVDASALVAIASLEPDWRDHLAAIREADTAHLSPANYVETGILLVSRGLSPDQAAVDSWLQELDVVVRDDIPLANAALAAYMRFGKGFHPARLNLSDCFAYALAKALDAPLLYKGDDFSRTDIRSALQPT